MRIAYLLLVVVATASCWAQSLARLTGTITDNSSAVIAGARVVARNASTGVTAEAESNSSGVYQFPFLVPAGYEVSCEMQGFKKAVRAGVVLETASTRTLDFTLEVGAVTGVSFLSRLLDRERQVRRHLFAQRLTHGSRPFQEGTTSHTLDLSRMVRSARHKLIYNCTPQQKYSPVDSYNEASWREMSDENAWGRLDTRFARAYFAHARPVFELYDLETDPIEMENLAGRPQFASIERELKLALQEKMILDYDYLPLPLTP